MGFAMQAGYGVFFVWARGCPTGLPFRRAVLLLPPVLFRLLQCGWQGNPGFWRQCGFRTEYGLETAGFGKGTKQASGRGNGWDSQQKWKIKSSRI